MINPKRYRSLNSAAPSKGPLLYWMDRERRLQDNWALLRTAELAKENNEALAIVYVVPSKFLGGSWRTHKFMLDGLRELEETAKKQGIGFYLLMGEPDEALPKWIKEQGFGHVVTDFSPLRLPRKWRESLAKKLSIPFEEVDARNVVPCWEASDKCEFAAYTIRPKIHRNLREFLEEFPQFPKLKKWRDHPKIDWEKAEKSIEADHSIEPVDWLKPGEKAAHKTLKDFLENKLPSYSEKRNDPNENALSNLSPYLHYGMISAQRVALLAAGQETFLEELIVRRELSDNFCFYNPHYDSFKGFHEWAQKTLNEHRDDPREYLYSLKEFEAAKTHDPLWNAAQTQLLKEGKMHGYMRMYWAKKILEWSASPEEALKIAITLNDRYELDGRDSNGYVGCAWSIGGVHDRAWTERPVFGKIRYMNYNGCKRKFDVQAYIDRYLCSPSLFSSQD